MALMNNSGKIHPRVWLEIDKRKLLANVEAIRKYVQPLKLIAVLKANAYGFGVEDVATLLAESGVAAFAVVEVEKAQRIKHFDVPLHILGALMAEEVPIVVENGFVAPITDMRIAKDLSREAQKQEKEVLCQLKIDTGMGRLGILLKDAPSFIDEVLKLPGLKIIGIYSHFPSAYQDYAFSEGQVKNFIKLINDCAKKGIYFENVHIANSDGIHNIPSALKPPFSMLRSGINLYGEYDCEGHRAFHIEPVLKLKTRLISVREMPKGTSIGYGRSFILDRPMRIGVVPMGYADGLPFAIPGKGYFLVKGERCPVVGRVSMDLTTVSLEKVPSAELGDEVLCLGDEIRLSDWAAIQGCTSYEILCSLGSRIERIFV